jgi:hypothetical protein
MLFISLLSTKSATAQERIAKRMEWNFPEGIKLLGEYWLLADSPRVITVWESDNPAAMAGMYVAWEDMFDITTIPAITGEQGLELAKKAMS